MKKIILNESDIACLKPISKSNSGCCGKCFEYNGMVLKVFHRPINFISSKYERIQNNLKRQNDYIMYPKDILKINERRTLMDGYTCDKAPGVDINKLSSLICDGKIDITFDDFLTAYYDRFLPATKKEQVIFFDVKPEHMFYDDNFYMIDTDLYREKNEHITIKEKDEINCTQIIRCITIFLNNFLPCSAKLSCHNEIANDKYLYKKIEMIRALLGDSVNSFGQLNNYKFTDDEIQEMRHKI